MKKLNLTLSLLLLALTAAAQSTQYVNTWIKVKAVPEASGTVTATFSMTTKPAYAAEVDVNTTAPTSFGDVLMLGVYTDPAEGYAFAGLYIDDGDGLFDPEKDQLYTEGGITSPVMYLLPTENVNPIYIFDDDLEAQFGAKPTEPQLTLFAYYTNGAVAEPYIYTRDEESGTVSITPNEPGKPATVTAMPSEGYAFDCWTDADGQVVSHDNPYTFMVAGGEHLYANFYDQKAPVIDFPEEGGWRVLGFDKCWYLPHYDKESYCIEMIQSDIYTDEAGRCYAKNMEEGGDGRWNTTAVTYRGFNETTYSRSYATVMWGKGKVRFAVKTLTIPLRAESIGGGAYYRDMIYWSTGTHRNANAVVTRNDPDGECYYAYVFNEKAGAFIQYAHTDWHVDPEAPTSVTLPKDAAYLWIPVSNLIQGSSTEVPKVIGLSPESYDLGMRVYNGEDIDEPAEQPVTLADITQLIDRYLENDGAITIEDITQLIDRYLSQN